MTDWSDARITKALKDKPSTGSIWVHSESGGRHVVMSCALLVDSREPCVVYRPLRSECVFVQPLVSWREYVSVDGKTVPRFQLDESCARRFVACPTCAGAGCPPTARREAPATTCDGSGSMTMQKAEIIRFPWK